MITYRQGDVILVPFPFSDQSGVKKRPAVVISAQWYNQERADCILLPITSSVRGSRDEVRVHGADVKRAGLLYDSVVRCGYPITIHQDLIVSKRGKLPRGTVEKIIERFQDAIVGD